MRGRFLLVMWAACVSAPPVHAQLGAFVPGDGARYALTLQGSAVELSVIIARQQGRTVSVEYHLASQDGVMPMALWQQFVLDVPPRGAPTLVEGYLLQANGGAPEKIPADILQKGDPSAMLGGLLLRDAADLHAMKVGEEAVDVPAGRVKAVHFRKVQGNRTLDFWISDEARPLGLVKLVSSGKAPNDNYHLELDALLKNVAPRIDPRIAVPMQPATRQLLGIAALRPM